MSKNPFPLSGQQSHSADFEQNSRGLLMNSAQQVYKWLFSPHDYDLQMALSPSGYMYHLRDGATAVESVAYFSSLRTTYSNIASVQIEMLATTPLTIFYDAFAEGAGLKSMPFAGMNDYQPTLENKIKQAHKTAANIVPEESNTVAEKLEAFVCYAMMQGTHSAQEISRSNKHPSP